MNAIRDVLAEAHASGYSTSDDQRLRDLSIRIERMERAMPMTIEAQIDAVWRDFRAYFDTSEEWPGDVQIRSWIRRIGYVNVLSALAQSYNRFEGREPELKGGRVRYFFGMMLSIERNAGRYLGEFEGIER